MKSTDAPSKQAVPFGTNGPREAITATTPSGSNQASYDQGFPPITMTLKSAGGLPPKGQDMNQILFEQSSFNRYFAAGGGYVYDSTFSTAVGGYPLSARIPNSTGTGFWFNTVEDNQTNPENSTSALTGWVPMGSYGVTSVTGLTSSSVTLTTLQASKDRIVLSGVLTANINLVVPAWIKRWEVINNCSGAFSVTVKTPSGTGVAVSAGMNQNVFGDGVNITALLSPGTLIGGPKVLTSSGTYTPSPGTKSYRVVAIGGGGGGGGAAGVNSTRIAGGSGGGAGGYAESYITTGIGPTLITIGTPGSPGNGVTGGTASQGGNGGATSFGSLVVASGGNGGNYNSITFDGNLSQQLGGAAGSGTIGDIKSQGGAGGRLLLTTPTNSTSGDGGSSFLSFGPRGTGGSTSSAGTNGLYGSGGSGALNTTTTGGVNGGAGGSGVIIVWEYA